MNRRRFLSGLISALTVVFALSCSSPDPRIVRANPGARVVINKFKPETRNSAQAQAAPYVVMVSIDGFRWDYAERFQAKNLLEMAEQGVSAEGLVPVYPSKTFPNHYAIVTGLYADQHGIISNEFLERKANGRGFDEYKIGTESTSLGKWYLGEPLWITAEKNGFITASFFWVGSEAPIQNTYPNWWVKYDKTVPNQDRVQTVINWLKLPADQRPHFVTLYFSDVDDAGHAAGPEAESVGVSVRNLDQNLGELRAQLRTLPFQTNLIVVSDHGMEKLDPAKVISIEKVDLSAFRISGQGTMMRLHLLDPTHPEKIDQAVMALKALGAPMRVYKRAEMSKLNYSKLERIGDIILEPDAPYHVLSKMPTEPIVGGNHGWDPQKYPNMRGIFYAEGPAFKRGFKLPAFQNIHIFPLIAEILGFQQKPVTNGQLAVTKSALKN